MFCGGKYGISKWMARNRVAAKSRKSVLLTAFSNLLSRSAGA
jgi:hypothetical protein